MGAIDGKSARSSQRLSLARRAAISKTLLDLNEGKISVKSEGKNRGASFTVELAAFKTPEATPKVSVPGNGSLPASLQGLLVDVSPDQARRLPEARRRLARNRLVAFEATGSIEHT